MTTVQVAPGVAECAFGTPLYLYVLDTSLVMGTWFLKRFLHFLQLPGQRAVEDLIPDLDDQAAENFRLHLDVQDNLHFQAFLQDAFQLFFLPGQWHRRGHLNSHLPEDLVGNVAVNQGYAPVSLDYVFTVAIFVDVSVPAGTIQNCATSDVDG